MYTSPEKSVCRSHRVQTVSVSHVFNICIRKRRPSLLLDQVELVDRI
jgi:hypothetical protein